MVVLAVLAAALVGCMISVALSLSDAYPRRGTSPRQRLLRNNPALRDSGVRWSVASRGVRSDRLTVLVVSVALYVTFGRSAASVGDDRDGLIL